MEDTVANATDQGGALAGLKVIDCTRVLGGPYCTQLLGDHGADIVKIEPPEGDTTRQLGPKRNPGMAAFFLGCNRSKRSIVLDLKKDEGRNRRCREFPDHWIRKVLNMRRATFPSEIMSARSSRSSLRYWKPRGPSICWRETVLR